MQTAKLFKNGQSQAVRLPKAFRFEGRSVYIHRIGDYVVLMPEHNPWRTMFEAADQFSDDFMAVREQGEQAERERLD